MMECSGEWYRQQQRVAVNFRYQLWCASPQKMTHCHLLRRRTWLTLSKIATTSDAHLYPFPLTFLHRTGYYVATIFTYLLYFLSAWEWKFLGGRHFCLFCLLWFPQQLGECPTLGGAQLWPGWCWEHCPKPLDRDRMICPRLHLQTSFFFLLAKNIYEVIYCSFIWTLTSRLCIASLM